MAHWELVFFFFVIAFIYASVGFGGGSSYLAVLALYALPFQEMRLTALICNVIVVTGGTIVFLRAKQVNWKKILPIIILSVPMAYVGAAMPISHTTFFILLGCSLITAATLLWMKTKQAIKEEYKHNNKLSNSLIGGGIGFLSGLVGIGGGIFLSPVLNLIKWDSPKKIAATASFFILVNSLAGIAGQLTHLPDSINIYRIFFLSIAVLAGGQIGSIIGTKRFSHLVIRRLTAILVFVAGANVLLKHWVLIN